MAFNLQGVLSLDTSNYESKIKRAGDAAKRFSQDSQRYLSHSGGDFVKQQVGTAAFGGFREKQSGGGRFAGVKDAVTGSLLARFGPAALGAATVKFGYDVVNLADNVSDMAERMDVSIGSVLRVEKALEGTGIKLSETEGLFNRIDVSRADAVAGNEKLRASFENLGVSVSDLLDPAVKTDKLMEQIGRRSKEMGRTSALGSLGEIFGSKNGTKSFNVSTLSAGASSGVLNSLETSGVEGLGAAKDITVAVIRRRMGTVLQMAGAATEWAKMVGKAFGFKTEKKAVPAGVPLEDPLVAKQQAELSAALTDEFKARQRAQEALLTTEEKRALVMEKINTLNFAASQISGMGTDSDIEAAKLRTEAANLQASLGQNPGAAQQASAVAQAQTDTLGAIGGAAAGTAYGVNASMEGLTILKELQRVMTISGVVLRQVKQ